MPLLKIRHKPKERDCILRDHSLKTQISTSAEPSLGHTFILFNSLDMRQSQLFTHSDNIAFQIQHMTWLLSQKIIFHLITNSASLNPLGHFEVAHCKVEPAGLKKRLPLVLCLPFQRDLVLQEVYHLCKTKLCTWH